MTKDEYLKIVSNYFNIEIDLITSKLSFKALNDIRNASILVAVNYYKISAIKSGSWFGKSKSAVTRLNREYKKTEMYHDLFNHVKKIVTNEDDITLKLRKLGLSDTKKNRNNLKRIL